MYRTVDHTRSHRNNRFSLDAARRVAEAKKQQPQEAPPAVERAWAAVVSDPSAPPRAAEEMTA